MNDENQDESLLPKSKSQIKREMVELQHLGEKLLTLNNIQLDRLDLPQNLLQAVQEGKKITSRSAKRRQLQYIGRLMRDVEDTARIEDFFIELTTSHQRANAIHHMLETWRDRLLSDDINVMTQFIDRYPSVDRQQLRQLIQNGKKEKTHGKPIGASKQLFRFIKELHHQEAHLEDHD